jgi:archaellum component FlaC
LRTLIGERLADYSNQVTRAQSLATRDLEDYRRGHDRTLSEIEASLRESEGAVQHLERSVAATSSKIDEISDQLNGRIERLEKQMGAVGQSLEQVERRLEGFGGDQGDSETLARLEETVARLGDAQSEETVRMLEAIEQQGVGDRLSALDERVDAIAELVSKSGSDGELERLTQHVANLTRGVETLRKRIALRARQEQALDQKSVQAIAASIAAQIAAVPQPAPSRSRWRSKRA